MSIDRHTPLSLAPDHHRYFDKGITAYWLDETDGEGTIGGDGEHGYDTTYGPAAFASNLWVSESAILQTRIFSFELKFGR